MAKAKAVSAPRSQKIGGLDKWEVENALDTLVRAEAIKTDTRMMKSVGIEAVRRQKALSKVKKPKRKRK